LGHVIRKSQVENLTGKFDGKKGPGRPRTSYLSSLRKWLDTTTNENTTIQATANGERWRDMIANSQSSHGTDTDNVCVCVWYGMVYVVGITVSFNEERFVNIQSTNSIFQLIIN